MQYPQGKIIVFCKAPEAGRVKTRLAKDVGNQVAVTVHEHLARHCLQQLLGFDIAPVELWCSPNSEHEFFQWCHSTLGVSLKQQVGDDLGQRMQHALNESLQQHSPVVLVGTDCPAFTAGYIQSAFSAVSENKTVIGPAEDGGYVLLGTQNLQADIFTNISWGSEQVCAQTLARLKGEVEILETLWDVDHLADLRRLRNVVNDLPIDVSFQTYLKSADLSKAIA